MNWPLAFMVSVAMIVIGTAAFLNKDVAAVTGSILTMLIAFGVAELREIKTSTNGNTDKLLQQNQALMAELAQYRQNQQHMMSQMLANGMPAAVPGAGTPVAIPPQQPPTP